MSTDYLRNPETMPTETDRERIAVASAVFALKAEESRQRRASAYDADDAESFAYFNGKESGYSEAIAVLYDLTLQRGITVPLYRY